MMEILAVIVGLIGTGLLGVAAWAFTISNDVAVGKQAVTDLERLIKTKDESTKELITIQFSEVHRRLDRIEANTNGHKR
jgi:hypothetical protein